jgi:predicted CXXCH cytochrome family protein
MKLQRVAHMPVREGKMECSTCHQKRGPFLFEHAAGREAFSTCHDPHGSSNDRMLVARTPMLCQRCHIGTRHPSTIYDATAFANKNVRVIGRSCVSCHSNIHGSNHPAGNMFLR